MLRDVSDREDFDDGPIGSFHLLMRLRLSSQNDPFPPPHAADPIPSAARHRLHRAPRRRVSLVEPPGDAAAAEAYAAAAAAGEEGAHNINDFLTPVHTEILISSSAPSPLTPIRACSILLGAGNAHAVRHLQPWGKCIECSAFVIYISLVSHFTLWQVFLVLGPH